MKTVSYALSLLVMVLFSFCSSEDMEEVIKEEEEETVAGANEIVFSDDNTVCTPHTSEPSISAQGILSVVMNPCQNSGSKLDAYFKYNSRPIAGTYTATASVGSLGNIFDITETQITIVFYGHAAEALYSTSGTVELSVNAADETKLDMTWTEVTMEATDGTSVTFSGSLKGI